jgi:hypothetical protein
VPDRKLAYRHLADSNLDWRGDQWYLIEYIRRHPGVILDPRKPQAGRIVVPVNALVGVNRNPEEYRWLREHFTPVDHIAYSFLVYDVRKEMLPQGAAEILKVQRNGLAYLALMIHLYRLHFHANKFAPRIIPRRRLACPYLVRSLTAL